MEGKTEMTTSYVVTHVICHIRTLLSDAHSIGLVRDKHRFSHLALGPALILGTLQIHSTWDTPVEPHEARSFIGG